MRPEGSLSAHHMPKFPSKPETKFGVEITQCDEQTGKAVYSADGSIAKVKVPMMDATLPNGQPQPLYFPAVTSR